MINLSFNNEIATKYKNMSQTIRVLSENWVEKNMYCPCCGNSKIVHFENNRPVADFYCETCKEQFELKSSDKPFGKKIVDGAYNTAIQRISSNDNPDLFVLHYTNYKVTNLMIIPKYFFTPAVIEKRKPLADTARRAGWIGCNILLGQIPEQGKIPIVKSGEILEMNCVVKAYKKTINLKLNNIEYRGWFLDVLNCVNEIKSAEFTLDDVYSFENRLSLLHPLNNNAQAKIRQQLQELRDRGVIKFLGNGKYKKI